LKIKTKIKKKEKQKQDKTKQNKTKQKINHLNLPLLFFRIHKQKTPSVSFDSQTLHPSLIAYSILPVLPSSLHPVTVWPPPPVLSPPPYHQQFIFFTCWSYRV